VCGSVPVSAPDTRVPPNRRPPQRDRSRAYSRRAALCSQWQRRAGEQVRPLVANGAEVIVPAGGLPKMSLPRLLRHPGLRRAPELGVPVVRGERLRANRSRSSISPCRTVGGNPGRTRCVGIAEVPLQPRHKLQPVNRLVRDVAGQPITARFRARAAAGVGIYRNPPFGPCNQHGRWM
jgi:hypothetical protein